MKNNKFVSFEVAKNLKMMGFNDACDHGFSIEGIAIRMYPPIRNEEIIKADNTDWKYFGSFTSPLISNVVDWLRDNLDINISISIPDKEGYIMNANLHGFIVIATGKNYYEVLNDVISKILDFICTEPSVMVSDECQGYVLEWRLFNVLSPTNNITEKCVCTIYNVKENAHVAQGSTTRFHKDSFSSLKAVKLSLGKAMEDIVLTKKERSNFWKEALMTIEYLSLLGNLEFVSKNFEEKNHKPVNVLTIDDSFRPHIDKASKGSVIPWSWDSLVLKYNGVNVKFKDLGIKLPSSQVK